MPHSPTRIVQDGVATSRNVCVPRDALVQAIETQTFVVADSATWRDLAAAQQTVAQLVAEKRELTRQLAAARQETV